LCAPAAEALAALVTAIENVIVTPQQAVFILLGYLTVVVGARLPHGPTLPRV
jgi:hypothetical protein